MNLLEALGNTGDFIGGIGVVVTLVYLAVQVRQNTAALRTASRQEIVAGMRAHVGLRLTPGAAQAWAEGVEKYPDVPFEEGSTFTWLISDLALFMQGAFALHESGTLEDETYQAYLDFFVSTLATPGGAAWWKESGRPIFLPRMVRAVDARLASGAPHDLLSMSGALPRPAPAPASPAPETSAQTS